MRAKRLRLNTEHPRRKVAASGEEFDKRQRVEETQVASRIPRPKLTKDRSMSLQGIDAVGFRRRLGLS